MKMIIFAIVIGAFLGCISAPARQIVEARMECQHGHFVAVLVGQQGKEIGTVPISNVDGKCPQ